MKIFFLTLCVFVTIVPVKAQNKIIVQISNFDNNKGILRACIFNNEASFSGEGGSPYQCAEVSIKNKNAEAVFENIPAGNYAIFVFHDENNNNKMDKNFLGIPKEGYGASKNNLPFAAAPTFKGNQFTVHEKVIHRIRIRLRNL